MRSLFSAAIKNLILVRRKVAGDNFLDQLAQFIRVNGVQLDTYRPELFCSSP